VVFGDVRRSKSPMRRLDKFMVQKNWPSPSKKTDRSNSPIVSRRGKGWEGGLAARKKAVRQKVGEKKEID